MKNAIVLDADDIRKIIAEKYGVDEKDVIKSQYSYTVVIGNVSKVSEPQEEN